ncbi:MAG: hypothetical protein AAGG38_10305 [Planctomycetota bacterium]
MNPLPPHPLAAPAPAAARGMRRPAARRDPRRQGIVAVLAMMFLLIFGSLAAAMAIVSQGNLRTADSHLKINRAMAAAEAGMDIMTYRLDQVTQGDPDDLDNFPGVYTPRGLIDDTSGYELWAGDGTPDNPGIAQLMVEAMTGAQHLHYVEMPGSPRIDTTLGSHRSGKLIRQLVIPAIKVGNQGQAFTATMTPHDLPDNMQPSSSGYDDPFYDRLPYGPPGGDRNSADQELRDQYERDMRVKREAGIDFIVAETVGHNSFHDLPERPLDARFIRVRVTAYDGDLKNLDADPEVVSNNRVYRSISMDFKLGKTIPYAVLSRSRVMIGRNVSIRGNVGSRFTETDKKNGHPVQIQSDFLGLNSALDAEISPISADYPSGGAFHQDLKALDTNDDNRLDINNPTEIAGWPGGEAGARADDADGDGYINEFDLFLLAFDNAPIDGRVTLNEFTNAADLVNEATAVQLFELMDTAGEPQREGWDDGYVDSEDLYSKIRGRISLTATTDQWDTGLTVWGVDPDGPPTDTPNYKDYFQGAVRPDYGDPALTTQDVELERHTFDQHSFDTKSFYDLADGDVIDGANDSGGARSGMTASFTQATPDDAATLEKVPYGAAYGYDYYARPIYVNKVFENARIEVGTNALFVNCRFRGVTYIMVDTRNGDPDFNYTGMLESSGKLKHFDRDADVGGTEVYDTKPFGNNLRFDGCTFEGPIVSGDQNGDQPEQFTHVRNKVTFTGQTKFDFANGTTEAEQELYERSSLLLPHMSVEMGSFNDGATATTDEDGAVTGVTTAETLELSGAVVAGLIDMRGHISLRGTLITTFEPVSGESPVNGNTAPNFNTTLGYFSAGQGDLEADLPTEGGLGKISLVYDPTLALPDGINGPVELRPLTQTYAESGR